MVPSQASADVAMSSQWLELASTAAADVRPSPCFSPGSSCPATQETGLSALPSTLALGQSSFNFAATTTSDISQEPTPLASARTVPFITPNEAGNPSSGAARNATYRAESDGRPARSPLDQEAGDGPQGAPDQGQSAPTSTGTPNNLQDQMFTSTVSVSSSEQGATVVPSSSSPAPSFQPTPQSLLFKTPVPASETPALGALLVSVLSNTNIRLMGENLHVFQQPDIPADQDQENGANPQTSATNRLAGVSLPGNTALQSADLIEKTNLDAVSPVVHTTRPGSTVVQADHPQARIVDTPDASTTTRPWPSNLDPAIPRQSNPIRMAGPSTVLFAPQTTPAPNANLILAGGRFDSDQGDAGHGTGGASGAAGHDLSQISYGGSSPQILLAAVVGGTLGATALVLFFILVILWAWRRRFTRRKRDSMDLYAQGRRLRRKGCENDQMEKGFANPLAKKAERRSPLKWMGKPFNQLSQLLSRTILADPAGVTRKRVFSRGQDTAVVNTSTDSGKGRVGRRRAASTLNGDGDFRIGMDLNLELDSAFNPFSSDDDEPARGEGGLDSSPIAHPSDLAAGAALDSALLPPPPPPAASAPPGQRPRSRSLGIHQYLKALDRTRGYEPGGDKDDKFHSDPFDLEFHHRLQHVSGLARISQRCEITPSSSRYTFGPSAFPHMDSFASRSFSGISYHEWLKLERDIRAAMMEDERSTLGSVDSRYSGERTVHRGLGM